MNHFSCYWTFSLSFGAKKSNVFHMVRNYGIVLWFIKHSNKKVDSVYTNFLTSSDTPWHAVLHVLAIITAITAKDDCRSKAIR